MQRKGFLCLDILTSTRSEIRITKKQSHKKVQYVHASKNWEIPFFVVFFFLTTTLRSLFACDQYIIVKDGSYVIAENSFSFVANTLTFQKHYRFLNPAQRLQKNNDTWNRLIGKFIGHILLKIYIKNQRMMRVARITYYIIFQLIKKFILAEVVS